MIDYQRNIRADTDRLIVAHYPQGYGGKFLLNCLGLSQHMVLQDNELARQQLAGTLNPNQKLDFLLSRLKEVKQAWCDLHLGCVQLFGCETYKFQRHHGFELRYHRFNPVIQELSHGTTYFASVAHDVWQLSNTLESWPGARVINLINADQFLELYRPSSQQIEWRFLRAPDWPIEMPANLDQYLAMPEFVKQEIQDMNLELYFIKPLFWRQDQDWIAQQDKQKTQELMRGRSCWSWETDWYLDQDLFLHQLHLLYQWLGLDDFNIDLLARFHSAYLATLEKIRPAHPRLKKHYQALVAQQAEQRTRNAPVGSSNLSGGTKSCIGSVNGSTAASKSA